MSETTLVLAETLGLPRRLRRRRQARPDADGVDVPRRSGRRWTGPPSARTIPGARRSAGSSSSTPRIPAGGTTSRLIGHVDFVRSAPRPRVAVIGNRRVSFRRVSYRSLFGPAREDRAQLSPRGAGS